VVLVGFVNENCPEWRLSGEFQNYAIEVGYFRTGFCVGRQANGIIPAAGQPILIVLIEHQYSPGATGKQIEVREILERVFRYGE